MDTALCGRSSLAFWRTPPLVRALANPSDLGEGLPLDQGQLIELRSATYQELGIWRHESVLGSRGRPLTSSSALDVLDAVALIAPSVEPPVEVIVAAPGERRRSRFIRAHVLGGEVTDGELRRVHPTLSVASPALTLLTLAPRLSLARLTMLVSELCGTFTVFEAPPTLRALLERLNRDRCLPRVSGWSPSFDREGRLTDLWVRPPLVSLDEVRSLARRARGRRGCRRLLRAAELAVPGAGSPFEVQTGVLLGFPSELGGQGYAGFTHNETIVLDDTARRIAGRRTCRCDLYWPGSANGRPLDLECQSRLFHASGESGLSDADRATALQSMGIDVVLVTHAQLEDVRRFDALSTLVGEKIGGASPERTDAFLAARSELRGQVLVSWRDLLD